ncbi:MAG: Gldg family protein [Planctomycetes bacterium]|nr:Gldg family protein [Planctomycetota bacterium]
MNWNVLKSIFKRDFVSYFSSPTGYVFICVFVVLGALATFWPPEFFSSNLANLDQLSRWLPFIMLVFIPAITMSIWAEERRLGTDELLLTVPASDFDVVLGKYLAGVAIFTVSLSFSAFSIFLMFRYGLGDPDPGLFASTYIGYWFIGSAMIAIGMVASFLTDNLTVGFILGTLFNLPLALFGVADWFIKNPTVAQTVRRWGALEQFRDFERGVVSLGGATYFVMLAVVMIYLSMVLIGRRHWQARDEGGRLLGHFVVRTLALLALAIGVTELVQSHNWLRADISSEQLNSLSPDTRELLREIRDNRDAKTIKIDAYVSPEVPSGYSATKLNFLSTLAELQALSGGKIQVTKHEIDNYGPEAVLAETTYGITPREVLITTGRERSQEEFFLAAAITSGLGKVVVPFLDKGIPVEYELVRSISTVLKSERLKVGILDTGIQFVHPSSDRQREWPLITELRKQYDIDDRPVDPSQPIKDIYDVLLVIQPSMLGPQEMDHLVDAVRAGMPVAILEDPHPHFYPEGVVGTAEPKRSQMAMFSGAPPEPKGDVDQLWRTLGLRMDSMAVVWQDYQPEQSVEGMSDWQWIFVDHGNGAQQPFNEDNIISSGLNQLLFIYPGYFTKDEDSKLAFEQLAVTGHDRSGTVDTPGLSRGQSNSRVFSRQQTTSSYIVAAQVHGTFIDDDLALGGNLLKGLEGAQQEAIGNDNAENDDAENSETEDSTEPSEQETPEVDDEAAQINAVVVADIDWIIPDFFYIRQSGEGSIIPATQNVTFILNIIDALAGDQRFINIRKRARKHRTLAKIDEATEKYRDKALEDQKEFVEDIETQLKEAQARFDEALAKVDKLEGLSPLVINQKKAAVRLREQERLTAQITALEANRKRKLKQVQYSMEQDIRAVQDRYKLLAIFVPPIPPLLVALYVFFRRREAEREGIAQSRLR